MVALGVVLLLIRRPVDPERFGRGLGQFAAFSALAGYGASYLFQTGRRRWGWVVLGSLAALVVAAVVVVASVLAADGSRSSEPEPLTPAEKLPLVEVEEAGTKRLLHPVLEFSFPHPGPGFVELTETELRELRRGMGDPALHAYGWFDETAGAVLVVGLLKDVVAARDLRSFQAGLAGALTGTTGARLEEDRVDLSGGRAQAVLRGVLGDGTFLAARSRVLALGSEGHAYLVALVAFTPTRGLLDGVLGDLRGRPD